MGVQKRSCQTFECPKMSCIKIRYNLCPKLIEVKNLGMIWVSQLKLTRRKCVNWVCPIENSHFFGCPQEFYSGTVAIYGVPKRYELIILSPQYWVKPFPISHIRRPVFRPSRFWSRGQSSGFELPPRTAF